MPLASLSQEIKTPPDVETGLNTETGETSTSDTSHNHDEPTGAQTTDAAMKENSDKFDCEMPTPGEVTIVTDLEEYEGANIYEKLDSFVASHQVVLVNRSWCLFSIDAVDFLVRMGVSIHSLEVDTHRHEAVIIKYLKQKYSHDTSPWIFISGEFVGGYEDVNTLYNTGTLQNDILSKLTQADKCEIIAAKSTTKPLFWFPVTVNAHAIRATGVATSLSALTSCIVSLVAPPWGQIVAYYLVLEFILRILGGGRIAPMAMIASQFVTCLEPKPRSGRPKQFASCCGFLFAFLGSICYLVPFPYHNYFGSVFLGILALCCGMEGFLDFCLGCVFFRIGLQLKIIPR